MLFRPLHTLLGSYPVYWDTNSLVVKSANSFIAWTFVAMKLLPYELVFLKQSFSIVLECFVAQSVVHNLTEIHHRRDSKDRFSVQRIQLRDTCLRFLEEIITLQSFCIIRVMLKMRICVYTSRRLQWIVMDCKRNLQQRQRTLHKKYCRCTSCYSPATFKSGVHLFAALARACPSVFA